MVYLGIFFLNYVLVNHLSIRTVPHNSTFVIAKTSVSNYTNTQEFTFFSWLWMIRIASTPGRDFQQMAFCSFRIRKQNNFRRYFQFLVSDHTTHAQKMPVEVSTSRRRSQWAPPLLPFLPLSSATPSLELARHQHLTSPPCLCVNTERFCRFCGCISFFPHTRFTFLEEAVWLSRDISWLPARWRGGAPSHPHLPVSWQAGRRCWPPPREAGRARWGGKGDAAPAHGACGHQESPARGAGASPTFARPSLWGQLLSPHLGATQVTGTQPHLCCCCFIHLLSSAVLQKLLPNYAPFFFFSSSIINIFSRVDSFPDHPPPTYTHACTYTL